jgi:hypothetical protein
MWYIKISYRWARYTEIHVLKSYDVTSLLKWFCPYHLFFFVFNRRKGSGELDENKVAAFEEQLNAKLDVYEKILSK